MTRPWNRAHLYPHLRFAAYWNFAAISPLSRPVQTALEAWNQHLASEGAFSVPYALKVKAATRERLADLLGGKAESFGLLHSTTSTINILAASLNWPARPQVVLLKGEFPANTVPWEQRVLALGGTIHWLEAEDFRTTAGLEKLESLLKAHPITLVAASVVQFQTGLQLPIAAMAKLCQKHEALLSVDAIQAAGLVPLDLEALGVDFAVGGGHKWLMATDGVSWVYVSPRGQAAVSTSMAGWLSRSDAVDFLSQPNRLERERSFVPAPKMWEGGSHATAGIIALHASLEGLIAAKEWAFRHSQMLQDEVEDELLELGFQSERAPLLAHRSGILALRPPNDIQLLALQEALAARSVAVAIPDGRLRLAPHGCSSTHEGDLILEAIRDSFESLRR